jgi:6-phosphogluconolactonase
MLKSWDDRRDYIVPGNEEETIAFAAEHWVHSAKRSIQQHGRFAVALSGGSTPQAIYAALKTADLDWSKVYLFWSDERAVPPDHPESNYGAAMKVFNELPIPKGQIFRMEAESNIEENAANYDELVGRILGKPLFNLVMLGLGEDGHTASLFPNTKALEATKLAVANAVPSKKTYRMTLTFPCINQSEHIALYALGAIKAPIIEKVLNAAIDSPFPASRIGTHEHKALYILDTAAARLLSSP